MHIRLQKNIASGVKGETKVEQEVKELQEATETLAAVHADHSNIRPRHDYLEEELQLAVASSDIERPGKEKNPLLFPITLMSLTSVATESVKNVFANINRSAFHEQNNVHSNTYPRTINDHFNVEKISIDPSYTGQIPGSLRSTSHMGFSNFESQASIARHHYLAYPNTVRQENNSGGRFENGDAKYKEQRLTSTTTTTNPITQLQREYSKYVLHNAIFKAGKDQSVPLTTTSASLSKPFIPSAKNTTNTRRQIDHKGEPSSSYANKASSQNSPINVPIVSQLQVMLTNQYFDNFGGQTKLGAPLHGRQILSSPVPPVSILQKSAESYRSIEGKHGSINSNDDLKAKMLDKRYLSAFTTREIRESGFIPESRSTIGSELQDANRGISLRQLRKMMEQIFHEELKRYGL